MYKVNIDKVRLCFSYSPQLFEDLTEFDEISCEGFILRVKNRDGRIIDENGKITYTAIKASVETPNNIGDFCFYNSLRWRYKCFFTANNKALYTSIGKYPPEFINTEFSYIMPIAESLNLTLCTITQIDLALDVKCNPVSRVRKLIKSKDYDLILNNKKVTDFQQTLDNYGEFYTRNRQRIAKTPTLYLNMANSENVSLKIYNKQQEITDNPYKQYIADFNNFPKNFWRLETTIKNDDVKMWVDHCKNAEDELLKTDDIKHTLYRLDANDYRLNLWRYETNRLIHFVRRRDRKQIDLFDVVNGDF